MLQLECAADSFTIACSNRNLVERPPITNGLHFLKVSSIIPNFGPVDLPPAVFPFSIDALSLP